jgi:hypothetical protein
MPSGYSAQKGTRTAPGRPLRPPCGSPVGKATAPTWPAPSFAWPAWPGDAGDWDQAALLCGAAEAFLDRAGSPWEESEARDRQDLLDQVRAHLGDEQLERAHAQGRALSLEKALDLALGKSDPAWH